PTHLFSLSLHDSLPISKGLPVTADVSVHHLLLDESAIAGFNSHCHIQPPLRSSADREALLAGVVDGTIDAVCSQHTPVVPSTTPDRKSTRLNSSHVKIS